jgi:hypothetical protein
LYCIVWEVYGCVPSACHVKILDMSFAWVSHSIGNITVLTASRTRSFNGYDGPDGYLQWIMHLSCDSYLSSCTSDVGAICLENRCGVVVEQRPRRFAGWPAHICPTQPCRPAYRETHSSASATHGLHEKCLSRLGSSGCCSKTCTTARLQQQVLSWRTETHLL